MNHLLEVCVITFILANGVTQPAVGQVSAAAPRNSVLAQIRVRETPMMRKGISVDLPVTAHAAPVPGADSDDSVILTVAHDGRMYLGVNSISPTELAEKVNSTLSNRADKTLYVKADAHIPYAMLISVLDSVHTAGVHGITLLTAQGKKSAGKMPTPPEGLEMLVVSPRSGASITPGAGAR